MTRLRCSDSIVFCLVLLAPIGARGQQMPTDTEWHAAACTPMMEWGVGVARQALAESEQSLAAARALPAVQQAGPEYLEGLRRDAAEQLAGTESALKRLQAYLMPHLTTLDPLAIVAANSRQTPPNCRSSLVRRGGQT
jgi:hypothetical protein